MNKLLIISGPTATGKTALAVSLLKKIRGEIISADSRQIYKDMDIGVGKDHPKDVPIHLIDLITPDQVFSASEYSHLALEKIHQLHHQNKLPIIVGGTGFYIDAVINSQKYNHFHTTSRTIARKLLDRLPLSVLQIILKIINRSLYNQLNQSDLHNPRRLSRKIEIYFSNRVDSLSRSDLPILNFDILHVSLTAPNQYLYKRIDKRVKERLKIGHLDELANLLKNYSWKSPGLMVSCYRHFQTYLKGQEDINTVISKWQYSEHRDARHQKTWFKRYQTAKFIDISSPTSVKNARQLIYRWYNNM